MAHLIDGKLISTQIKDELKTQVHDLTKGMSELMRVNFGISYNNGMNTFQPDFIVKFADGTVQICTDVI